MPPNVFQNDEQVKLEAKNEKQKLFNLKDENLYEKIKFINKKPTNIEEECISQEKFKKILLYYNEMSNKYDDIKRMLLTL